VNVARYQDVGVLPGTPADIAEAVRGYAPNIDAARVASAAPITASAVIEASKLVDTHVIQAWVAQSGNNFVMDAQSLTQIADAGVSADVTDAMVAAEANSRDAYDLTPYWGREAGSYWDQGTGMKIWYSETDPWTYGFGPMWRYGRGYQRYAFGTNNWSWMNAMGWTNGYGGPMGFGSTNASNTVGSMLPPTIVLHNDPSNAKTTKAGSTSKDNTDTDKSTAGSLVDDVIKKVTGKSSSKTQPPASSKPSPR